MAARRRFFQGVQGLSSASALAHSEPLRRRRDSGPANAPESAPRPVARVRGDRRLHRRGASRSASRAATPLARCGSSAGPAAGDCRWAHDQRSRRTHHHQSTALAGPPRVARGSPRRSPAFGLPRAPWASPLGRRWRCDGPGTGEQRSPQRLGIASAPVASSCLASPRSPTPQGLQDRRRARRASIGAPSSTQRAPGIEVNDPSEDGLPLARGATALDALALLSREGGARRRVLGVEERRRRSRLLRAAQPRRGPQVPPRAGQHRAAPGAGSAPTRTGTPIRSRAHRRSRILRPRSRASRGLPSSACSPILRATACSEVRLGASNTTAGQAPIATTALRPGASAAAATSLCPTAFDAPGGAQPPSRNERGSLMCFVSSDGRRVHESRRNGPTPLNSASEGDRSSGYVYDGAVVAPHARAAANCGATAWALRRALAGNSFMNWPRMRVLRRPGSSGVVSLRPIQSLTHIGGPAIRPSRGIQRTPFRVSRSAARVSAACESRCRSAPENEF